MLCSRDRELAQTEATVKPELKGILKKPGECKNPVKKKVSKSANHISIKDTKLSKNAMETKICDLFIRSHLNLTDKRTTERFSVFSLMNLLNITNLESYACNTLKQSWDKGMFTPVVVAAI